MQGRQETPQTHNGFERGLFCQSDALLTHARGLINYPWYYPPAKASFTVFCCPTEHDSSAIPVSTRHGYALEKAHDE